MNFKNIQNKIVISTFHQVKGLERKLVVIFNFNMNYYNYYAKYDDQTFCPNLLYVACTRATQYLLLVGENPGTKPGTKKSGHKTGPLPFLSSMPETSNSYLDIINCYNTNTNTDNNNIANTNNEEQNNINNNSKCSVTRLIKFLPEIILSKVISLIKYKIITPANRPIDLPSNIKTNNNKYEDVSDLTGLAIPALYESITYTNNNIHNNTIHNTTHNNSIHMLPVYSTLQNESIKILQNCIQEYSNNSTNTIVSPKTSITNNIYKSYLNEIIQPIYYNNIYNISFYLRLASIYRFCNSGFSNKPVQIQNYDWVTYENAKKCLYYLELNIPYNINNNNINNNINKSNSNDSSSDINDVYNSNNNIHYEEDIELTKTYTTRTMTITGRIDAICSKSIWELKCTNNIDNEHILQLAVYAYIIITNINDIYDTNTIHISKEFLTLYDDRSYKILNMRTGEVIELITSYNNLTEIMNILIEQYIRIEKKCSDEEFLEVNRIRRNNIFASYNHTLPLSSDPTADTTSTPLSLPSPTRPTGTKGSSSTKGSNKMKPKTGSDTQQQPLRISHKSTAPQSPISKTTTKQVSRTQKKSDTNINKSMNTISNKPINTVIVTDVPVAILQPKVNKKQRAINSKE